MNKNLTRCSVNEIFVQPSVKPSASPATGAAIRVSPDVFLSVTNMVDEG